MIKQGRLPGPLGMPGSFNPSIPGGAGRQPGVLGFGPGIVVAQVGATAAVHKLPIPRPLGSLTNGSFDYDNKDVHVVTGDLFNKQDKERPVIGDVRQGIIGNCALASILAAHANTRVGRTHIKGMVNETKNVVVETGLGSAGELINPPPGTSVTSSRFFTVTLGGKQYEVSDVFYTDDGGGNSWSLLYMRSPTNVLWPPVIEKALAVRQKGYDKIDDQSLTANDMWEVVTGKKAYVRMVTPKLPDADILKAARASVDKPTIAGSKPTVPDSDAVRIVNGHHGFAMLGVVGGKIEVHDPGLVRKFSLTMKQFRAEFDFIMTSA